MGSQEAEKLAKWASYENREKEKQAAREERLSLQLSAKEDRLARKAANKAAKAAQLSETRKCVSSISPPGITGSGEARNHIRFSGGSRGMLPVDMVWVIGRLPRRLLH